MKLPVIAQVLPKRDRDALIAASQTRTDSLARVRAIEAAAAQAKRNNPQLFRKD